MVLAKAAGTNPRALAELITPKLEALPTVTSVEIAGPGFINLRLTPDAWRDELRTILAEGDAYGLSDDRQGRAGQCRICLGQPDRAAAHGPLPRRGGRRQPGAAARSGGLPGHQGILCQRRRRAGRYARPLGAPALPRGARRGHRRDPRGHVPGRLSGAGRARCSPPNMATDMPPRRRANGCRCSAPARSRRCSTSSATTSPCSASTTTCSRPRPSSRRSGAVERALETLRGKGLVYEGELERPKSLDPHDEWEPVELTLFRSTQFGDDQDRPMKKAGRQLDLFRRRRRLSSAEGRKRRPPGQHLGRRPCRHGQAGPGGGQGADRRPRRPRRQAGPDGAAVPRRRADQDVQARRATSSRWPRSSRKSARTSSAS